MPASEISLQVHVVLFSLSEDRLRVLLSPCHRPDAQGCWELPGVPLLMDESLEEAAQRALSSPVDRRQVYLEQLYTYGDCGRSKRGLGKSLVSVVYFALAPAASWRQFTPPEADCWFPVEGLPALVFNHGEILRYALRRLRYKLEYSAVAFQLLPDTFTLSEIQHTYEIILGERLDKRNFRRRILRADVIEETSQQRSGEGRPARLYRYRPDAVAEVKARRLFP
jgi:8-oxo-dGTP diphosphatase